MSSQINNNTKTQTLNTKTQTLNTTNDSLNNKNPLNCRICFEEIHQIQIPQICKCKNEESSINIKCLSHWIQNVPLHKKFPNKFYIFCTMCHSKIQMDCFVSYECLPWKKVEFFGSNLTCTISAMVILLIGLMMVGISLALFVYKNLFSLFQTIATISLVLGLLVLAINITIYVFHVCMSEKVLIMGMKGLNWQELKKNIGLKQQDNKKQQKINADSSLVQFQLSITSDQFLYTSRFFSVKTINLYRLQKT